MEMRRVIYKSRRRAVAITVAGVVLVAVAGLLFFYLNDVVFGWIFVICSALLLILGIGSWLDRKPQVILTDRGITDLTTTRVEIEWNVILQADDFWYRGQDFVRLLIPANYKVELLRSGWFWRLDKIYAQEGVKALYIRTSGLDVNSAALVGLIRSRLSHDVIDG